MNSLESWRRMSTVTRLWRTFGAKSNFRDVEFLAEIWIVGTRIAPTYICAICSVSSQFLLFSYRLAPEHLFPAGLDDCKRAVVHFLSKAHRRYGVDPSKVVIVGDSAGGNLAAVTAQHLRNRTDIPALKVHLHRQFDLRSFLAMPKKTSSLKMDLALAAPGWVEPWSTSDVEMLLADQMYSVTHPA